MCRNDADSMRNFIEHMTDWGKPAALAQIAFARAYDSVKHTVVAAAIQRRAVPLPIIGMCLRQLNSWE